MTFGTIYEFYVEKVKLRGRIVFYAWKSIDSPSYECGKGKTPYRAIMKLCILLEKKKAVTE